MEMNITGLWITGIALIVVIGLAWRMIEANRKLISGQSTPAANLAQTNRNRSKMSLLFTRVRSYFERPPRPATPPGAPAGPLPADPPAGQALAAPALVPQRSFFAPVDEIRRRVYTWFVCDLMQPEAHRFKFILTLTCVATSTGIGLVFHDQSHIYGWQLASWATMVLTLVVLLTPPLRITWRRAWIWLGLLFLVALALRITFLDRLPDGLHTDEIGVADFTLHQVFVKPGETINPFITGSNSQPSFYNYVIYMTLSLLGNNIFALRSSSAVVGALAVLATFAAVAVLQNKRTAFFAAILMATFHYHLHWSRLALNNIWDTFWVPAMIAAYAWGWKKGWGGGAVLAGLALGLSQYFYAGSKISIFLMALMIFVLWRKQPTANNRGIYLGKFLATSICVAAPILVFAVLDSHPYIERTTVVWGWNTESILMEMHNTDLVAFFWHQVTRTLGAFFIYTDVTGFYRPGVPFLIGLSVPLFLAGGVMAFFKRQYVPLVWLALVAFFGGFLLNGNPSSSHYITSIPAICWLVAMPLSWMSENGRGRWALALLAVVVCTDLYFYFGVYSVLNPGDFHGAFPPIPVIK
jgi:hypothetical protein